MSTLPNKKPDPLARINKMREYEEKLQRATANVMEEKKFAALATWQDRSDVKVKNQVIQQRFEALKVRREARIDERRRRLSEKLYNEDLALRHELVSSQETPEQRRAKLAARARELAATREAERAKLAQELYAKAFQENCDVLREANSKRILYRTIEERNAQIEQRMATRILEQEERRMWDEMNEQERIKAEQRYLDDKRRQKESREAVMKVLDEQVRAVQDRRKDEADARLREIEEMRALWDKMEQEQEEAEAAERERMKRLAFELQEFNRIKQMEISERERRERELDLKILQEALAREAFDEAREQAERQRQQEEVRRYRQQLALMMQRDAEETAERDAMINRVFLEQQARKDAEYAAREEARRRLLEEVDMIRQQQIREKQMQRHKAAADAESERRAAELDAQYEEEKAAQRRMDDKKKALQTRLELQTQMVAKAHIKAAEEDDKLRMLEVSAQNEAMYMGQVKEALEATDPAKWFGRKKFNWYD